MEFFNTLYFGNTFLQWLIALLIITGAFIAGRLLYWVFSRWIKTLTKRTKVEWDDLVVDMAEEPLVAVLVLLGVRYALSTLTFDAGGWQVIENAYAFLIAVIIAWGVMRLYDAFHTRYLQQLVAKTQTDLDDQLLPIIRSSVRFIVLTLGVLIGLNNAGYNVGAVLAGLGIGGLAFAFAAQDTVSNIFGGITVFFERPFKLGDRINVLGKEGYVRVIGLRCSQIETINGEKIILPNKYFIAETLTNTETAAFYYQAELFRLHHDSSLEAIQLALHLLSEAAGEVDEILWAEPLLLRAAEYSFELQLDYGVEPWAPGQPTFNHLHKMSIARSKVNQTYLEKLQRHQLKLALPIALRHLTGAQGPERLYSHEL